MGYENDPDRDEDGEALIDYDDIQSDPEATFEPHEDFEDDLEDNLADWGEAGEGSHTPAYDNDNDNDKVPKPRKRLVKKSNIGKESFEAPELADDDEDVDFGGDFARHESGAKGRKRKEDSGSGSGSGKKEKRHKSDKKFPRGEKKSAEIDEMWDSIAHNPENDEEGLRTLDDDNFIDDTGVDPSERYEARSPGDAPQAEEGEDDDEINELFKVGKKKKKHEKSPAEIAMLVERVMAELEVTAEEDAELNRQGKPAINKLKKLSLLTEVLSKKQLQPEFLDHGVLTLLKNWLEPLPDGSLPNINIRAAILKILTDFPIDLDQYDRREQLKKSGLGKVIMFLSKSDEETTSNRRLAKDLVDKWSRPIFNKSTRFEDMRNSEDIERAPYRRPLVKKPASKPSAVESREGDFDLDIYRKEKSSLTSGQNSKLKASMQHASRPEATPMDFLVRPQSKIDPDEVRARAKQVVHDQRRIKMNKKLQQLKAPKKKSMQASKISVEGRGMVKYL